MRIALYIMLSGIFFYYQVNVGAGVLGDITNKPSSAGLTEKVVSAGNCNDGGSGGQENKATQAGSGKITGRFFNHPGGTPGKRLNEMLVSQSFTDNEAIPVDNNEKDFSEVDITDIGISYQEEEGADTNSSCARSPLDLVGAAVVVINKSLQSVKDRLELKRTYAFRSGENGSNNNVRGSVSAHENSGVQVRKSKRLKQEVSYSCATADPCRKVWSKTVD